MSKIESFLGPIFGECINGKWNFTALKECLNASDVLLLFVLQILTQNFVVRDAIKNISNGRTHTKYNQFVISSLFIHFFYLHQNCALIS